MNAEGEQKALKIIQNTEESEEAEKCIETDSNGDFSISDEDYYSKRYFTFCFCSQKSI